MKYSALGTKLYRGSSSTGTLVASLKSIDSPELKVDMDDVTTLDSTLAFEEVVATIIRTGELAGEIVYDPAAASHKNAAGGLVHDLLSRTAQTWTLVWSDTAASEWSFSGFVAKFKAGAEKAGHIKADIAIKVTGVVTVG